MPDKQDENPPAEAQTAAGRYEQLTTLRSPALFRARQAAELTIPALMPPEGGTDATELPTPFQGVGARGTNNLASKLLLALFPPGSSFFRLKVDEFVMDALVAKAGQAGENQDPRGELEEALGKVERAVMTRLDQTAARPTLNELFKHLIACGNGLLFVGKHLKFYALDKYVCKRDGEGEALEVILKENLNRKTLPSIIKAFVTATEVEDKQDSDKQDIALYTWIRRTDSGSWKVHQEICGKPIPGTNGSYPKDKCAWFPLRWQKVSNSDYGRGHVEEYIGDLASFESLSQSIIEFAGNASKIVWLVDEGGVTSKSKLDKAASGAIIDGKKKDVECLGMEKFADFQVASATGDKIERRLEQAFLLNSSIQRQAERVTAEEIRFMAGELEQALGGTYSILAQELQHPLVVRLMNVMQKEGKLPHLPEGVVHPEIITGLDGLGRSSDLMKLDLLVTDLVAKVGNQAVAEYINVGGYIKRRATALNIDVDGIVRSEEEVQKARQAAAQQAIMEKSVGPGIKAMSDQALSAGNAPAEA